MGRASLEKGKRGERECRDELIDVFGGAVKARRGCQFQGGPESPDVVLEGVPIHVEAKRTERLALWPAVEQAGTDAPTGAVPIVWHKCNRKPSVVIVETARLYDLAVAIVEARKGAG
jgi:hypothetical protein